MSTDHLSPAPAPRMRVLCGMSGGVDSAVAAALLMRAGHEVIGVTFRIGSGDEPEGRGCCSARQACDAAECAAALGIKHFVAHAEEDFHREVVAPFAAAYARGETPNPCIECNRAVRFPAMLGLADELGAQAIATGHYARVEHDAASGRYCIARGADPTKDQSYVLYSLGQETLARLVLPLGAIPKTETRRVARELGLPVAGKPDSQDICFVPDGDYRAFLLRAGHATPEPGPIVDTEGRVLGRHEGAYRYTVGQRRGLGIAGPEPLYVLATDPSGNTVTVGPARALLVSGLRLRDVTFGALAPDGLTSPLPVLVQLRAHGQAHPATLSALRRGAACSARDEPTSPRPYPRGTGVPACAEEPAKPTSPPNSLSLPSCGREERGSSPIRSPEGPRGGDQAQPGGTPTGPRSGSPSHLAEGEGRGGGGGEAGLALDIRFEPPRRTTAAGQSAVCYDAETGRRVLCGGVVECAGQATAG